MRPLARRAASLLSPRAHPPLVAVELGSGAGVEARFLAEQGFDVHGYDSDPSVGPAMARLARTLPIRHTTADLAQIDVLPAADLILSCATLPFVPRTAFSTVWSTVRDALRPGGVVAVDLFGDRDDWTSTDGTFLARAEVLALLDGLEIVELSEEEREGRSFAGPKHWHTYRVLARRP
ncbi:class I SAM-dependent methyltransferase [Brachybacterium saurashtrense]|uniref:Class I SAM-dependent methyltransferase n=1 Tax=Brachybacterium saurashtrense TaxID=556288 RepID=A0A345YTF7_9MICO|nr:class I SAM-dependent methyltransferase [Brachybacterium saurashtrense]RRR21211.1 class I SAM-dependent methyltransferase [Brachybacterium saurashtrense]